LKCDEQCEIKFSTNSSKSEQKPDSEITNKFSRISVIFDFDSFKSEMEFRSSKFPSSQQID
jgi:hypothetical protein